MARKNFWDKQEEAAEDLKKQYGDKQDQDNQ
jgi:hypothetical protein